MITPAGELKVMDFGISRSYAEDSTMTGSVVGTPAYMAPEQAEGKDLDHRTDIYAFGLVLYEMFTGEAAFSGDTAVTVALKQIRERPRKPTTLTPGIPKRIEVGDPALPGERSGGTLPDCGRRVARTRRYRAYRHAGARLRRDRESRAAYSRAARARSCSRASRPHCGGTGGRRIPSPSRSRQFTLANGLTVGLAPDHAAPTITIAVDYRAGTRRDTPGHTGLAHLVQHVMHEGSPNVARGEYRTWWRRPAAASAAA